MSKDYSFDTLPVGGGTLAIGPLPGRQGALADDVAQIGDFAPGLVVSMTGLEEMQAHGAAALPDELARHGIDWAHMPIVDYGAPDPEAEARWPEIAEQARAILARGGRVFVHCKGGMGRSGMVALRLMVESGEDPQAALARLRQARPGTVETPEQARWAAEGAADDKPGA